MRRHALPGEPIESAVEWGRRQAAKAPPWSDAKWRRICALLRINIDASADTAMNDDQADRHSQPGPEAA
jgi:hypothetical protein